MSLNRPVKFLSLLLTCLLANACGPAAVASSDKALRAGAAGIEREQDRNSVLSTIATFADSPDVENFFKDNYGCAIFPTIGKGGIGIGGAHGKGWVFRKGALTGEVRMTQVTIGWQLGGQAYSQIIFFKDAAAYKDFTAGNFELGAQASAVAITVGVSAQADTSSGAGAGAGNSHARRDYVNGMAIFTVAKGGLMYEASVGGQKFNFRPIE